MSELRDDCMRHWYVRRLMREWRRVRPRVLVAETQGDWGALWLEFKALGPYIRDAFRLVMGDDEPNTVNLTGWAFCMASRDGKSGGRIGVERRRVPVVRHEIYVQGLVCP
ncbi:hypothetical protein [Staphylospora marina]|uniref:hypothetical protein n=1 Tax=Staphylospora marina TaxID=2490858 RepID=UPI000F5B9BE2|nr:hypothetical protein [Staphylospora marina]